MTAESNPLFSNQWHFNLIGDIQTVWDDYTGDGVTVAVYDNGTEQGHEDLAGNYNAALHYSGLGSDDGQPNVGSGGHGTAVAGLIAAENNGLGGVGVAFEASITGVDLLGDLATAGSEVQTDVLRYMENFDITNNSWGGTPTYSSSLNLSVSDSAADRQGEAFQHAADNGRGGLGTIMLKAAGNENNQSSLEAQGVLGNAQGDGRESLHTLISVAASDQNGNIEYYSNWGSSLLITGPAGAVTTDLSGSAGYASGEYTTTFGGTSAATPVTAGVVALMLEANDGLGWRDVQNILAASAAHTGSAFGTAASGFEEGDWFSNGATNWNGGGMSYSISYGFGMVDAHAAVRMAEVWDRMHGPAQVSANEQVVTASFSGNQAITDNTTASVTINVTEGVMIEHIYVSITGTHTYIGDLTITLEAPTGEQYLLFERELLSRDLAGTWVYGVAGALDVSSLGDWVVHVQDSADGDEGTITGIELEFRGSAISTDTVHHITADFQAYAAVETGRALISDTDGGTDWLNMVAVPGNTSVDLTSGAIVVEGTTWANIDSATVIENVATGDGDDTVLGSNARNEILGGRGDDSLRGEASRDTLEGGAGADTLYGNSGADTLLGGEGNDLLVGGTNVDSLSGGAGDDTLFGGSGDDTLEGGTGADQISGGWNADDVRGGTENDTLNGDHGADTLRGEDGADVLLGGDGVDVLAGNSNDDTLRGGDAGDLLFGGTGNDILAGNGGDDSLSGGGGEDRLFGGSGADTLDGGAGQDVLGGGSGADVFVFDAVSDSAHGATRDRIVDFTHDEDMIDLSDFAGTLSFVASYTGAGNEVRYNAAIGRLYIDLDGDGSSDFSVNLSGAPVLDAGDLIL